MNDFRFSNRGLSLERSKIDMPFMALQTEDRRDPAPDPGRNMRGMVHQASPAVFVDIHRFDMI